jgi:ribosomal protein S18 acetylase RimI-like enzyme
MNPRAANRTPRRTGRLPHKTAAARHPARPPIRIRALAAADISACVALVTAVFHDASIDRRIQALCGGPSWKRVKGAAVRQVAVADVENNRNGCFVAVRDNRIVGYISTTINLAAARGCICDLAVAAECQGLGIGARLIRHVLRRFRKLGLQQAKIETLDNNLAGQHLYPKLGFVEVARQIHYVQPL